ASYYKCDACHYEYRLQRLFIADLLTSSRFQILLTVLCFAVAACALGTLCQCLAPFLLPMAVDQLHLPPAVGLFLIEAVEGKGNPACWHGGYNYNLCCRGGKQGNPSCWDGLHDFHSCCEGPSQTMLRLHSFVAPALRLLCSGCMGLSVVGFAMYLHRQVREAWGQAGAGSPWQAFMLVAWLSSFGAAIGRLVAVVGAAVALRELYMVLSVQAKRVASRVGERILEVA
ncbi:unnamed protein product, partial [Polarella glacialis]